MNALVFLMRREIVNGIKLLLRRPLLPIFYIVLMGFLFFSAFLSISDQTHIDLDRFETMLGYLQAGGFLLFGFVFLSTLVSSMKGGVTLFGMADVNLLFSSPISPQKIIVYGVLRQSKQNILITLLFLFQIPILANNFNLGVQGIAGFLLAWFMLLMSASLSSMTLFALSSKSDTIRNVIKVIFVTGLLAWFVSMVIFLVANGATPSIIVDYISLPIMNFIPFIGWSVAFMMAAIEGDLISALLFMSLNILVPLLGIEYMRRSRMDYYEDVLGKTEKTFLTMQAAKDGKQISNGSKVKVSRIRKLGLAGKGRGASILFWRQITEYKRSTFFIFDAVSIPPLLFAIVGGLILRHSVLGGSFGLYRAQVFAIAAGLYLLYFLSVSGKFAVELKKTHIYMIPASRFLKLFYATMPQILKAFLEGVICFLIVVLVVGLPLWLVALAPIMYASFSGIYASVLLFSKWITGEGAPKIIQTLLFFIGGIIVVGPAVAGFFIPFIILVNTSPYLLFLPYIISSLIAIMTMFSVLGLCRGALDKIES